MSELREGVVIGLGRDAHALQAAVDPSRRLTDEQAAVVASGTEPVLVVAGAGSGKTETLSLRILYLLDNARRLFGRDIAPDELLCLTFTRKAAAELAERVEARINHVFGHDPARPEVAVSTYNAYAASLVADHGLRVGVDPDSTILTDAALWQLATSIVDSWTDTVEIDAAISSVTAAIPRMAAQMRDHELAPETLRTWADEALAHLNSLPAKPGGQEPSPLKTDLAGAAGKVRSLRALVDLVEEFERRKREGSFLDFSDQVSIAVRLARHEHMAAIEAAKYRAVLLDEFQDTSPPQLSLFASLFAGHPVMAVGDPNQAIYGFRGASADALAQYERQFSAVTPVTRRTLSVSWRNEASILTVANAVVAGLDNGAVVGVPLRSRGEELGIPEPERDFPGVVAERHLTLDDEAEAVAAFIQARRAELGHSEAKPVTAAVLCRRRAQYDAIAHALTVAGIEYEIVGLGGLMDVPEVADLLALLEIAHDPSRGDSLMRLLTGERLALGPRDLMALQEWAQALAGPRATREGGASIVDALAELPPEEWVSPQGRTLTGVGRARLVRLQRVVDGIRRHTYLPLPELISYAERAFALDIETAVAHPHSHAQRATDAFIDASRRFALGAEHATLGAFLSWLEAARREENGLDAPVREPDPLAVQILTVHGSKGLEWDIVAVPGLNDGQFPSVTVPSTSDPAYRDSGWLDGLGQVPYELRLDAARLPQWSFWDASDQAALRASLREFKEQAGEYVLGEERRLFYVALTRARSHVLLSCSCFSTGVLPRKPSLYLAELVSRDAVAVGTWVEEHPDRAPEPVVGTLHRWPRPATPAQLTRRALARLVRDAPPEPDGSEPLMREITAMLAERAARAATPVTLPSHVSTSALVSMSRDREAFLAQLRRPMPQEPTFAAHQGSTLHAWIERQFGHASLMDEDDLDFGLLGPDEAEQTDLDALKATFAASEWAARTPIAIEVDVELPVAGVTIRSRIDAVFPPGHGLDKVTVVDWKSGRPPRDPHDKAAREVQLAVYRIAWSRLKGIPLEEVDAAFYYVAADATVRPERLLSEDEIVALIRSGQS